ncbi:hypothetical protein FOL47_005657 [Perkinsus chesapeaki]|uniref:Uncharacterized protein n=1 Tax=Perkinsus chesapeaki TaxID=330153 RepID=A0A7J6LWS4_PERCH|nr:hypothetical protein FOL47_005657 [Perkinsus chesapeaki]
MARVCFKSSLIIVTIGLVLLVIQLYIGGLGLTREFSSRRPWVAPSKQKALPMMLQPSTIRVSVLVDETSGRPSSIEYILPQNLGAEEPSWTSIQCLGWRRNRSCAFDNIYYDGSAGNFFLALPRFNSGNVRKAPYSGRALQFDGSTENHTDTGVPVDEDSVRKLFLGVSTDVKDRAETVPFNPDIRFFSSKEEFQGWMQQRQSNFFSWLTGPKKVHNVEGVSLHWQFFGALDVGHFLYDSLYPAWITAVRFGHTFDPINMVPLGDDGAKQARGKLYSVPHWTTLEHFGQGDVLLTSDLTSGIHSFSRLLVGSRFMGHRNPQRSMSMPGAYSYENALFWFGQRLLAGFGMAEWPSEEVAVLRSAWLGECRGVITDNKRFDERTKSMLKKIAANSQSMLKCNITFLEWEKYSYKEQLEIIGSSDLYISSTGTGLTRCHLTRPHGAVVHLGSFEHVGNPQRYQVSYRDVHFATGSPHLASVFYSRRLWNIYGELQEEGVIDAIQRGMKKAKELRIPRPYEDALSPTSETWERYCNSSSDDCQAMVDVQNGNFEPGHPRAADTYMCEYCSWVDYFGIAPMWTSLGCMDGDKHVRCPLDHQLLKSVMKPDDIAFEPECYDREVEGIRAAKHGLLSRAAAVIGKTVETLTASEAVSIMLQTSPPNCPFELPREPPSCAC